MLIKIIILIAGYFLTFLLTDLLIKKLVLKEKSKTPAIDESSEMNQAKSKMIKDGYIIGKCENIIILSFILSGEVTGLALIFAAKNLVRQKDINDNAGYFLVGTMVNFTATLILGYILKFIIAQI